MVTSTLSQVAYGIATEIANHVAREGSHYGSWYIGITDDIPRRLFGEHAVPEQNAWWIHRRARSDAEARSIGALSIERRGHSQ